MCSVVVFIDNDSTNEEQRQSTSKGSCLSCDFHGTSTNTAANLPPEECELLHLLATPLLYLSIYPSKLVACSPPPPPSRTPPQQLYGEGAGPTLTLTSSGGVRVRVVRCRLGKQCESRCGAFFEIPQCSLSGLLISLGLFSPLYFTFSGYSF